MDHPTTTKTKPMPWKNESYLYQHLVKYSPVLVTLNVLAIKWNHLMSVILGITYNINDLAISGHWMRFVTITKRRPDIPMVDKPMIKEALAMLDVCGLKPTNQNVWSLLRAAFAMILCLGLSIELLLEILYNWRGLQSMEGVSISAAIYQLTFKVFMAILNSDAIAKLLNNIDQFPGLDTHGTLIKHKIENIYLTATKYTKIILIFYGLGVINYLILPYFLADKTLPLDIYHPVDRNKSPDYQISYFLQGFILSYESFGLLGFDLLFISSILHLLCELHIIKLKLSSIRVNANLPGDEEDCLSEVYQLIDHHNLVMKCIKRLEKIYSVLLLNQFLSSLVCICAALLSIIANGFPPDALSFFKYAGYLGLGLAQLFSYCLAGAYLIVETEKVAWAAYESQWWVKTQPKLRNTLVLVIQRANREGKLTAGGMYVLDLESFTSVVKNALSFFTIVQAVYTRSD